MRINAQIKTLSIDLAELKKDVRKSLYDMFYTGISAFLEVAAPAVPVDTGMARGSFLNLQQMLRSAGVSVDNVDIPITARRYKYKRSFIPLTYYHTDGRKFRKEPNSAKRLSTQPDQIISEKLGKIRMIYQTDVKHFNFNEYKRQWFSFKRGKDAMYSAMNFGRLSVLDYLTTSTIIGGGGRSIRNQRTVRNKL